MYSVLLIVLVVVALLATFLMKKRILSGILFLLLAIVIAIGTVGLLIPVYLFYFIVAIMLFVRKERPEEYQETVNYRKDKLKFRRISMVSNILLFCQISIGLYSVYINLKNSKYMKKSNWGNSMLCYVFLGMIIDKIDNIYTKVIVMFVMFLILINELNTIKILKNNDTNLIVEKI